LGGDVKTIPAVTDLPEGWTVPNPLQPVRMLSAW
jgi:hypothetical protein